MVEKALKQFHETRDSDKKLLLAVWYYETGLRLTLGQKVAFYKGSPAESITRKRRKLQSEGKYHSSKEIRKKRIELEKLYRQNYR